MTKRKTLRQFVAACPRSVRQFEIAADLGLDPTRLSKLLAGQRPTKTEIDKLRERGIEASAK